MATPDAFLTAIFETPDISAVVAAINELESKKIVLKNIRFDENALSKSARRVGSILGDMSIKANSAPAQAANNVKRSLDTAKVSADQVLERFQRFTEVGTQLARLQITPNADPRQLENLKRQYVALGDYITKNSGLNVEDTKLLKALYQGDNNGRGIGFGTYQALATSWSKKNPNTGIFDSTQADELLSKLVTYGQGGLEIPRFDKASINRIQQEITANVASGIDFDMMTGTFSNVRQQMEQQMDAMIASINTKVAGLNDAVIMGHQRIANAERNGDNMDNVASEVVRDIATPLQSIMSDIVSLNQQQAQYQTSIQSGAIAGDNAAFYQERVDALSAMASECETSLRVFNTAIQDGTKVSEAYKQLEGQTVDRDLSDAERIVAAITDLRSGILQAISDFQSAVTSTDKAIDNASIQSALTAIANSYSQKEEIEKSGIGVQNNTALGSSLDYIGQSLSELAQSIQTLDIKGEVAEGYQSIRSILSDQSRELFDVVHPDNIVPPSGSLPFDPDCCAQVLAAIEKNGGEIKTAVDGVASKVSAINFQPIISAITNAAAKIDGSITGFATNLGDSIASAAESGALTARGLVAGKRKATKIGLDEDITADNLLDALYTGRNMVSGFTRKTTGGVKKLTDSADFSVNADVALKDWGSRFSEINKFLDGVSQAISDIESSGNPNKVDLKSAKSRLAKMQRDMLANSQLYDDNYYGYRISQLNRNGAYKGTRLVDINEDWIRNRTPMLDDDRRKNVFDALFSYSLSLGGSYSSDAAAFKAQADAAAELVYQLKQVEALNKTAKSTTTSMSGYNNLAIQTRKFTEDADFLGGKVQKDYTSLIDDINKSINGINPQPLETLRERFAALKNELDSSWELKIRDLKNSLQDVSDINGNNLTEQFGKFVQTDSLNQLKTNLQELQNLLRITPENGKESQYYQQLTIAAETYKRSLKAVNEEAQKTKNDTTFEKRMNNLFIQAKRMKTEVRFAGVTSEWNDLCAAIADGSISIEEASRRISELKKRCEDSLNPFQRLVVQIKDTLLAFSARDVLNTAKNYLKRLAREMITNMREVNKALTEFQIVSNQNDQEIKAFADDVFKSAKKISASFTDVVDAATVFSRLGYSSEESLQLSEMTTMFSRLGGIGVSEAEDAATAVLKAFKMTTDDLQLAMDKMVKVGNNFPISAAQIGEALNNASSALAAGGNNFDQSIALLTAANTTVQDASKSSTALRTITARIRNTKTELTDLGEEVDENVNTTAKYRKELQALSGVDILDESGGFRSTYDILDDLASKWGGLSDQAKAAITTQIAGVRNVNVFSSIMENFEEARKVMGEMGDAAGFMSEKYEVYTDSVEAANNRLKTSFQELSADLLNSDLAALVLNLLSGIVGGIDIIIKPINFILGVLAEGLNGIWDGLKTLNDTSLETFGNSQKALEDVDSQIEGLNEKIEENIAKMKDLQKQQEDNGYTDTIAGQISKLREETDEYRTQIGLLEQKRGLLSVASTQDALNMINSRDFSYTADITEPIFDVTTKSLRPMAETVKTTGNYETAIKSNIGTIHTSQDRMDSLNASFAAGTITFDEYNQKMLFWMKIQDEAAGDLANAMQQISAAMPYLDAVTRSAVKPLLGSAQDTMTNYQQTSQQAMNQYLRNAEIEAVRRVGQGLEEKAWKEYVDSLDAEAQEGSSGRRQGNALFALYHGHNRNNFPTGDQDRLAAMYEVYQAGGDAKQMLAAADAVSASKSESTDELRERNAKKQQKKDAKKAQRSLDETYDNAQSDNVTEIAKLQYMIEGLQANTLFGESSVTVDYLNYLEKERGLSTGLWSGTTSSVDIEEAIKAYSGLIDNAWSRYDQTEDAYSVQKEQQREKEIEKANQTLEAAAYVESGMPVPEEVWEPTTEQKPTTTPEETAAVIKSINGQQLNNEDKNALYNIDLFSDIGTKLNPDDYYAEFARRYRTSNQIDLANRRMMSWQEMADADWDIGSGTYATLFSQAYTRSSNENFGALFTPILQNATMVDGVERQALKPEELDAYASNFFQTLDNIDGFQQEILAEADDFRREKMNRDLDQMFQSLDPMGLLLGYGYDADMREAGDWLSKVQGNDKRYKDRAEAFRNGKFAGWTDQMIQYINGLTDEKEREIAVNFVLDAGLSYTSDQTFKSQVEAAVGRYQAMADKNPIVFSVSDVSKMAESAQTKRSAITTALSNQKSNGYLDIKDVQALGADYVDAYDNLGRLDEERAFQQYRKQETKVYSASIAGIVERQTRINSLKQDQLDLEKKILTLEGEEQKAAQATYRQNQRDLQQLRQQQLELQTIIDQIANQGSIRIQFDAAMNAPTASSELSSARDNLNEALNSYVKSGNNANKRASLALQYILGDGTELNASNVAIAQRKQKRYNTADDNWTGLLNVQEDLVRAGILQGNTREGYGINFDYNGGNGPRFADVIKTLGVGNEYARSLISGMSDYEDYGFLTEYFKADYDLGTLQKMDGLATKIQQRESMAQTYGADNAAVKDADVLLKDLTNVQNLSQMVKAGTASVYDLAAAWKYASSSMEGNEEELGTYKNEFQTMLEGIDIAGFFDGINMEEFFTFADSKSLQEIIADSVDASELDQIKAEATVDVTTNPTPPSDVMNEIMSKQYSITVDVSYDDHGGYTPRFSGGGGGGGEGGTGGLTGSANLSGTAYIGGKWGSHFGTHKALVGEIGQELMVDPNTGTWRTIGDYGPEIIDVPDDAIIFNDKQTKGILSGRGAYGRGTQMHAVGTAYGLGKDSSEARLKILGTKEYYIDKSGLIKKKGWDAVKKNDSGGGGGSSSKNTDDDLLGEEYKKDAEMLEHQMDLLSDLLNLYHEGSEEWFDQQSNIITTYSQAVELAQKEYERLTEAGYNASYKDMRELAEQIVDWQEEIFNAQQDYWDAQRDNATKTLEHLDNHIKAIVDLKEAHYDLINSLEDEGIALQKEMQIARDAYPYLTEAERMASMTDEDYAYLLDKLSRISKEAGGMYEDYLKQIEEVGEDASYELDRITEQMQIQYDLKSKEYATAKAELAVLKARKNLENVMEEKSVATLVGGMWVWTADSDEVKAAMEELADAEQEYAKAQRDEVQGADIATFENYSAEVQAQIDAIDEAIFSMDTLAQEVHELKDVIWAQILASLSETGKSVVEDYDTYPQTFADSAAEALAKLIAENDFSATLMSAYKSNLGRNWDAAQAAASSTSSSSSSTDNSTTVYIGDVRLDQDTSSVIIQALRQANVLYQV